MRILEDIIDDVAEDKMPSHEECYYALKVYRFLFNMDHQRLRAELLREKRSPDYIRQMNASNSFDTYKTALSMPPKDFCGE